MGEADAVPLVRSIDQEAKRWKDRLQRSVLDKNISITLSDLVNDVPAAGAGLLELVKECIDYQQGIKEVIDVETATKRVLRDIKTRRKDTKLIARVIGTVNLV